MADKSNDNKEDQIRVVDDEPAEVVRLDAEKVSPLQKKGKISHAALVPAAEPGHQELPAEKKPFDPEKEWLEDEDDSGPETVPMGWFVLLVVGLLGVLGWVVFQTMTSGSETVDATLETTTGYNESPKGAETEEEERREAEAHFKKMEKAVIGFLKAETLEEMVKWVRHPERVTPLMKSYYARNPIEPHVFKSTDEYHIASLESKPFIALSVRVEDQKEGIPILLEDRPDGMLVDWESYVCYLPMSPEDLAESKPTELVSLRVYAQRDTLYTYEFEDDEEYDCFRLLFRGSEITLYGYVKKGTSLEREFLKMFPAENYKYRKPLIIKARFLEGGKATQSMLIEDLESTMWAFPNNPTKVDKKD